MVHQRSHPDRGMDRADFAVIGFGRFGRFAAGHLARRGRVIWWDPKLAVCADVRADVEVPADMDMPADAKKPAGAEMPADARMPAATEVPAAAAGPTRAVSLEEACCARTIILAVPIGAMREVLETIRGLLLPGTLVVDTCSVKVWPCRWMLEALPREVHALGTHPLFGPDSAAAGLHGQPIAFVPLRLGDPPGARAFLESFGLRVVETTAEQHDRDMAETQSIVHWLGRALERTGARPRELQTTGYQRLLGILDQVTRDSWELFHDLQRWNPYAAAERARLLGVLAELDREIREGSQ